ncbi:MAG: methyltransferase [Deltaproteobacteria bacterium]|nr:methyltransferase [Deltaproteobacteria bacterium]
MTRTWESPLGPVPLTRWPVRDDDPLQAWDGADTYLIEALLERATPGPILVVGDAFGGLSVALAAHGWSVTGWGDSELARLSLEVNARRLGVDVPWIPLTQTPPASPTVLVRIPKGLKRLEWTLRRLSDVLPEGATVLLGAKSKQVQKSHVALAELLGPAASTRAAHRSRLVIATRDASECAPMAKRSWSVEGMQVRGRPGVFGEDRCDPGTALLLEEVPRLDGAPRIVDLGCGAGPLGLVAGARSLGASLLFRDASHAAVASARDGWEDAFPGREASFEVGDAMDGVEAASCDLVLCNPPFHQGTEVTRRVAAHMFAGSARALRDGGRLLVVGNQHLGYHVGLSKVFRSVRTLRSSRRFVVLEARTPR